MTERARLKSARLAAETPEQKKGPRSSGLPRAQLQVSDPAFAPVELVQCMVEMSGMLTVGIVGVADMLGMLAVGLDIGAAAAAPSGGVVVTIGCW